MDGQVLSHLVDDVGREEVDERYHCGTPSNRRSRADPVHVPPLPLEDEHRGHNEYARPAEEEIAQPGTPTTVRYEATCTDLLVPGKLEDIRKRLLLCHSIGPPNTQISGETPF